MWSGADLRNGSQLVSFNHVTDPHSVTFSSCLYTTIRNPNRSPDPNPALTLTVTLQ